MPKNKTPNDIFNQLERCMKLVNRMAIKRAKLAHPDTGGMPLYVSNWGNTEARLAWARRDQRMRHILNAYNVSYDQAIHAGHVMDGENGRYLWCEGCGGRKAE